MVLCMVRTLIVWVSAFFDELMMISVIDDLLTHMANVRIVAGNW